MSGVLQNARTHMVVLVLILVGAATIGAVETASFVAYKSALFSLWCAFSIVAVLVIQIRTGLLLGALLTPAETTRQDRPVQFWSIVVLEGLVAAGLLLHGYNQLP
jgi:hypothetical protein